MLDDMVWYRSTKIALYGPSGGPGIFFRQVLMLFERSAAHSTAQLTQQWTAQRMHASTAQRMYESPAQRHYIQIA